MIRWIYIIILSFGLLSAAVGQATDSVSTPPPDTLKTPIVLPDWLKPRQVSYTIGYNYTDVYVMDTLLDGKQYYNPVWKNDFSHRNLGNLGTPAVPVAFLPPTEIGFNSGLNAYDLYKFTRENLRWYDTWQPVTRLELVFGANRETMASVFHNQNIGQQFNFTFHFNRYGSPGVYDYQETDHNSLALTTRFKTKKEHYKLAFMFLLNSLKSDNNGGVQSTDIFEDTSFITQSIVQVELSTASTQINEKQIRLRQEVVYGKSVHFVWDSTERTRLYPELTFYHEASFGFDKYRYYDSAADSAFYGIYYSSDSLTKTDSLKLSYRNKHWGNRIGITYEKVKSADSINAVYRNFVLDVYVDQTSFEIQQTLDFYRVWDVQIGGELRSHPASGSPLFYKVAASYALVSYNAGDRSYTALAGYRSKRGGAIWADAGLFQKEQPWTTNYIVTYAVDTVLLLPKTQTASVGIHYRFDKPFWTSKVHVEFSTINNYVYWNKERFPTVAGSNIRVLTLGFEQNFRFWDMGLDNNIRLFFADGPDVIRIPSYWGKHTLYYEKVLFNGNLRGRVGVDVWYNTNYQGYGYFPLTGNFYVQNQQRMKFYPVMDAFISMQIAEAVFFFSYQHVNQGMFKEHGYFNAYKYPAQNRAFKVGLVWRFYN